VAHRQRLERLLLDGDDEASFFGDLQQVFGCEQQTLGSKWAVGVPSSLALLKFPAVGVLAQGPVACHAHCSHVQT
jgi:hypothetical protein